jgi:hypothetical protein
MNSQIAPSNQEVLLSGAYGLKGNRRFVRILRSRYVRHPAASDAFARSRFPDRYALASHRAADGLTAHAPT